MNEPTPYDLVPYTSHPYPLTHPDRLHVNARLFGMTPAPVTQCRVLELGCASGGNLIPMACQLPESEFVGIDLSRRQLEAGRETIETVSLENIRLVHGSILDVDESWGSFDYVICHGVYSWVAAEVRDKILSICAAALRPQGVAYVSYNTYPGWHMREMVRHMVRYHAEHFDEPEERVSQARALIDFLARFTPTDRSEGLLLREELDLMGKVSDDYIYHDLLEEQNTPLYFHQFDERAQAHGLQYLGEAEFHTMLARGLPDELTETLERIARNITAFEQYMDFLRNRSFRCTLLCHAKVPLERNVDPTSITDLLVCAPLHKTEEEASSPGEVTFRGRGKRHARTSDPATKAALHVLGQRWPVPIAFEALVDDVRELLRGPGAPSDKAITASLARELLFCHARDMVDLRSFTPAIAREAGERPRAPRLARHQARQGRTVTNLRHESASLDAVTQNLVPLLDGKTPTRVLIERLARLAASGAIKLEERGARVDDPKRARELLETVVSDALLRLGRSALLEG